MDQAQAYEAIFADAHQFHAQALTRLRQGDIRNAAENAWCATKRATDALIMARTGQEPQTTAMTTAGLLTLARESTNVETLIGRYLACISYLHGSCFQNGTCGPDTERRIRDTIHYIRNTEDLAIK